MSTASRWFMDLGIRVAKVLGWMVAAIVALVGYIYYHSIPYEHRFRLTFDVTVDGQVRQGTGVISVFDTDLRKLPLSQSEWKRRGKGPSPWVDLGKHGILLIAISLKATGSIPRAYHAADLSFVAFYGASQGNPKISEETVIGIHRMQGKRELPAEDAQFIWLPNPNDPNSAVFIPPASKAALSDVGIEIGNLTIEITDDKRDDSIYARLPWLADMEQLQREHPMTTLRYHLRADHVLGDIF